MAGRTSLGSWWAVGSRTAGRHPERTGRVLKTQPTLSDGTILLTPFSLKDASALVEADRDPEMALRFDFPPTPPTPTGARKAIRRWQQGWHRRTRVAFAVRDRPTGTLIGGCEVRIGRDRIANVSYFTVPAHRGRGVASRAVTLLTRFAFAELGVDRLEIKVEVDNVASRRVAARARYLEEGVLRAHALTRRGRRDMVLYSRLRTDADR